MKLAEIKPNSNNPRVIKDDKFNKLKSSITDFPQMMELRPMVIDENNIVLGGNMRLRALQDLGFKEIPDTWVKRAAELTEEQKKEFIIKDNVGFGEWDYDVLANEFDIESLTEWGLDLQKYDIDIVGSDILGDSEYIRKPDKMVTGDGFKVYIGNYAMYISSKEKIYSDFLELEKKLISEEVTREDLINALCK